MEQQLFWILAGGLVCLGIRRYGWHPRRVGRFLAVWLVILMIVQFSMVIAAGVNLLQSILPLHLCSATAFAAIPMLWRWDRRLFQFCWYLGMPGAFVALCVPVVGYSPWPRAMQAVFLATHSVLFLAPVVMRCSGVRPMRLSAWNVFLAGNALVLLALGANALVGSNYMFLNQAPAGTPLAFMASGGRLGYLAWLEAIALLLLRTLSLRADRAPHLQESS